MIIAPYCCCDQPTIRREKLVALQLTWINFFTVLTSDGFSAASSGAGDVRFRTWVRTYSNETGTKVVTIDLDKDNGASNTTTETPVGYDGWTASGTVISSTVGETFAEYTYEYEVFVGPGFVTRTGTFRSELTNQVTIQEQVELCYTRLQELFPMSSMRTPITLNARSTSSPSTFSDYVLDWYDAAAPSTQGNYFAVYYHDSYPWDETYEVVRINDPIASPAFFATVFGGHQVPTFIPAEGPVVYSGFNGGFSGTFPLVIQSIQELPDGIGCDNPDAREHDLVLADINPVTGVCYYNLAGLRLSPGWYSFNGRQFLINGTGSKLSGSATVDPGAYGTIVRRSDVGAGLTTSFPDPCPP